MIDSLKDSLEHGETLVHLTSEPDGGEVFSARTGEPIHTDHVVIANAEVIPSDVVHPESIPAVCPPVNDDLDRPRRIERGIPEPSGIVHAQSDTLLLVIFRKKLVVHGIRFEIRIEDVVEHRVIVRSHRHWAQEDLQKTLLGTKAFPKVRMVDRQTSAREVSLAKRYIWKFTMKVR